MSAPLPAPTRRALARVGSTVLPLDISRRSQAKAQAAAAGAAVPAPAGEGRPDAAGALRRERLDTARRLLPGWKSVSCCGRWVYDPAAGVKAVHNANTGRARFCGVGRCGSVWVCPECAAKVSEARCTELRAGVAAWRAAGNTVAMVTLTVPHGSHQCLPDLLAGLRQSMADLQASRDYKDARRDLGAVGQVRALEVTVGEASGWHPHIHQLVFIQGQASPAAVDAFADAVFSCWQRAVQANGLGVPARDAFDCQLGATIDDRIADYFAKWHCLPRAQWGAERELTKAMQKRGKAGRDRLSPFGLLDVVRDTGDAQCARWFLEYACAFKGQRQLVWSRGLRDRLAALGAALDERTDQEILDDADGQPGDAVVAIIPTVDWDLIVRSGGLDDLRESIEARPTADTIARCIARARHWLSLATDGRTSRVPCPDPFAVAMSA